jgi:ADP-ribose pyrophosphatase
MKFEKINSKLAWTGKVFDVVVDTFKTENNIVERQYITSDYKAVVVLPITNENKVVLVSQFRSATGGMLAEVPAGKTEPSEDLQLAALRELEEETGYKAQKMTYLGNAYASPGISSEMYHFYVATDLVKGQAHPDDDEDTEPLELPFDEFVNWMKSGKITDTKTIAVTGLWLMRNK